MAAPQPWHHLVYHEQSNQVPLRFQKVFHPLPIEGPIRPHDELRSDEVVVPFRIPWVAVREQPTA